MIIKQMIIHSNCRDSLGEFSNTLYCVLGAERVKDVNWLSKAQNYFFQFKVFQGLSNTVGTLILSFIPSVNSLIYLLSILLSLNIPLCLLHCYNGQKKE